MAGAGLAAIVALLSAAVVLLNLYDLWQSRDAASLRLLVGPLFAAVAAGLALQSGFGDVWLWLWPLLVLVIDPAALPLLLWLWWRDRDRDR